MLGRAFHGYIAPTHQKQIPIIDKMLNWHIEKNQKVKFLSKYPDYAVHIKYDAPNFKVRIGDFRTKNEALKLLKDIDRSYPMAFIVPDKINFPLLKKTSYE